MDMIDTLQELMNKLEVTWLPIVAQRLAGEAWREVGAVGQPPFLNAWANHSPGTFQTCAFYKDGLGIVRLKGLVKDGTLGATGFTLPVGYRPPLTAHFVCLCGTAGTAGGIRVNNDGNVVIGPEGTGLWMSLEQVAFRAAK